MNIAIFGAGLSGCVATGAFQSYDPYVIEAKRKEESGVAGHKAVLRLRDPDLGKYLGCQLKEILVQKQVYWKGEFHDSCSIPMLNTYSRKLYDSLGVRSIMNLGVVKRWLLPENSLSVKARYGSKVTKIHKNKTFDFDKGFSDVGIKSMTGTPDIIISTMPFPITLKLCGIDVPDIFNSNEIHIVRGRLCRPSEVHQTVYFPDFVFNTYRATIEGNEFMLEGIQEISMSEVEIITEALGVGAIASVSQSAQVYGKISCTDDDERKALIQYLTEEYGIYSFGRFAIWKAIRADELTKDIEQIMSMINISSRARSYNLKLEGQ